MSNRKIYLAVDLGASSGRVLAGIYDGETIELRELNRFPSEAFQKDGSWHWKFDSIFSHIKKGIALATAEYGEAVISLGVDTWGVDYGLIDGEGNLLEQPYQYRDSRTDGMMEKAYGLMPKSEIYQRTGIQFMFFNTLFQLLGEQNSGRSLMEKADRLLFMPDLVNYFLTGRKVNERSIASTGQLLDARSQSWDHELLKAMGFPASIFGELVEAGTVLGELKPELARELGSSTLKVVAVGCHDTASAVAGVPALEADPVFLSSGTWSLIGRELSCPILTTESFKEGFSNEGGVLDTTRFLKNIAGMWLVQECKKKWDEQGQEISFGELVELAQKESGALGLIDPDAKEFQAPADMPKAIADYCRARGQAVPERPGQFVRMILESLADRYAEVKVSLEKVTGREVKKIYIVGGGSQNRLLNQLAANATGCEIVAGPVEATSLGNILMQMIASGDLKDLKEGRRLVAKSFAVETFLPNIKN
ncbi:MAG: rhamnulokinase family protein [Blastochloris sp.]|nr:rhamnulokinase family protein [Blastochloris sp.]